MSEGAGRKTDVWERITFPEWAEVRWNYGRKSPYIKWINEDGVERTKHCKPDTHPCMDPATIDERRRKAAEDLHTFYSGNHQEPINN